ncbi:hypothetical protein ROZALSC1DRAFT_30246, partial [Rozella allomycis CSF55]
ISLVAIMVLEGAQCWNSKNVDSLDSGHYVSFVAQKLNGHDEYNVSWIKYDDMGVNPITLMDSYKESIEVLFEYIGKNAYMLFYELIDLENLVKASKEYLLQEANNQSDYLL